MSDPFVEGNFRRTPLGYTLPNRPGGLRSTKYCMRESYGEIPRVSGIWATVVIDQIIPRPFVDQDYMSIKDVWLVMVP